MCSCPLCLPSFLSAKFQFPFFDLYFFVHHLFAPLPSQFKKIIGAFGNQENKAVSPAACEDNWIYMEKKTHLQTWHFIHHQHGQALAIITWKLMQTEGNTYVNVWSQTNGVSADMFSVLLLLLTQLLLNPLAENDKPGFQAYWTALTGVSKATEVNASADVKLWSIPQSLRSLLCEFGWQNPSCNVLQKTFAICKAILFKLSVSRLCSIC